MKTIEIKKVENRDKNILIILKTLYSEGSEIKSLEDIEKFMETYNEKGIIKINFHDEVLDSLNFIKENLNLTFTIQ
ncbi:hypothetical protein DI487_06765 [Flavobacterium sediminis]|uniref:Uncharacterized protein n=1 Tax=Flavobacterium sediminis TaxID=2201181 RepID=A0A2U8QTT3_9FLAO|nr:hypothetical protein [Flavobacterium sediminis]AWM13592.1 hypothetical protein DI487_06765 [Flavobacterium sediminis]